MRKTIIALILILSTCNVFAQSFDEDLQRRYFLSRNRLKKWFVTANEKPGGGYPIEKIQLAQNQFNFPIHNM